MIVFKLLRWKNLLSYGNAFSEIDLSANKTSLIVGPNGCGKTTLIDALCFVLYNRSFRNTNKPLLINSITQKNMVVEVEFEINDKKYFVRRGMKPNVFEIYRNEELIDQTTGTLDYQAILEKQILKMNFKTFTQIVILGSANYQPFMKLAAQARREVIEDLLDTQVFSIMFTLLKDKVSENKTALLDIEQAIAICDSKIDLTKKHILELQQNNQVLIDECLNRIKDYEIKVAAENIEIELLKVRQDQTETQISKTRKESLKANEILALSEQANDKLQKLYDTIAFYEENTTCPTCKQEINEAYRQDVIISKTVEIEALDKIVKDVEQKNRDAVNTAESRIRELTKTAMETTYELTKKSTALKLYKQQIKEIEKEIEKRKAKNETKGEDIGILETERQTFLTKKEEEIKIRELYNSALVLLKDGGIKSRIVSQYIPIMNSLINKSLELMNFFCQFTLDENFNEKIKSRFRDEFNYESFSEGEKKRIDLALMFTWREISRLRNAARTNILIFDEILDSSLDNDGMDDLIKIIKLLSPDTNTLVISHKSDQFLDKFDKVLEFRKIHNFSQMVTV
jgi:DNA repair exonuclease SbcCD ATPase subunit